MATYYVSSLLGNNAWDGTSPTFVAGLVGPKATLNGAEDIPVAANDTVWVQGGNLCVYREQLTLDVSGNAGNPITYCADVLGQIPGWGASVGMARITGSDNDQTATRNNCITQGAQRDYRTFRGFKMDMAAQYVVYLGPNNMGTDFTMEDCVLDSLTGWSAFYGLGANQARWMLRRCFLRGGNDQSAILISHSATLNDVGHVIENCILTAKYASSGAAGVAVVRVGGITVRNCTMLGMRYGVSIATALAAGQTVTVNGCAIECNTGLAATVLGEITENYNALACAVPRVNVAVGANSNTYPALIDWGIFHAGASQASGYRMPQPAQGALSFWSQVRAIADGGTNATLDLFGQARPATDGKRSWGAVQYQGGSREATTVQAGTYSLRLDDAGRRQFRIPSSNVATTVSVYAYREANYAGANPQMIIKQPGVADRTTTDAGAAGAWNLLTDTFTPAAQPGWFVVELVSNNTDAANPATNDAFFDTLTVSVNTSLGLMETWLWDDQVADWVQNVPAATACDYPAPADVRDGVSYDFGAQVGTYVCSGTGRTCHRWPNWEPCKFPR